MAHSLPRDPRRLIPAVDRLLGEPRFQGLIRSYGRRAVRVQLEACLEDLRQSLEPFASGLDVEARLQTLPTQVANALGHRYGSPSRRVINATGIFLHTNLGRAPLPVEVCQRAFELATGASDLEFDLTWGRRGDRNRRLVPWLRELTGAEGALVVNNNAAALVLAVAALASGREVIVSRGELVEIGGSFRIPEILKAAGARLREVGTTNRTYLDDYRRAVGPETGLLLKVHASNYRQTGFVASASLEALAGLARERGVPLLFDLGSGLLRPRAEPALQGEPNLADALAQGADLACGSADKLLGGPQGGILVGRQELIDRLARHPLARALRLDRIRLVALEAVLRRHHAGEAFPLDRLWPEPSGHRKRLERVAEALGGRIVPAEAFVGGGSAPERPIPGEAVAVEGGEELLLRLRGEEPPVIGYLRGTLVIFDLRTVEPEADALLVQAVLRAQEELGR